MSAVRRRYGELDRATVIDGLYTLARRVGVERVTMRALADELNTAVPSLYYHVPTKQAALDLLADEVLARIGTVPPGSWDTRLVALYCSGRAALLEVPGIAGVLQASPGTERIRAYENLGRELVAQSGAPRRVAAAAHAVLYTHLLGSVSLEHARPGLLGGERLFTAGLALIIAGLTTSQEGP